MNRLSNVLYNLQTDCQNKLYKFKNRLSDCTSKAWADQPFVHLKATRGQIPTFATFTSKETKNELHKHAAITANNSNWHMCTRFLSNWQVKFNYWTQLEVDAENCINLTCMKIDTTYKKIKKKTTHTKSQFNMHIMFKIKCATSHKKEKFIITTMHVTAHTEKS